MKVYPKILWAMAVCWLVSCSHDKTVPRGMIGVRQMSDVLLDMQIANAYNDNYFPANAGEPRDREKRIKTFYRQILMLHHTDKETFLKSYHFYEEHPDLMKEIYGLMQKRIDQKSAYADSVKAREERLRAPHRGMPEKIKNFLFPFRSFADSVLPPPPRSYRPEHDAWKKTPPVKMKHFLLLYQAIADSIHYQPRRIFNPDLLY